MPSFLFAAADSRRYGRVAFNVLNEPTTSMSMTVLKAFVERPVMGARKLPAAPALYHKMSAALSAVVAGEAILT